MLVLKGPCGSDRLPTLEMIMAQGEVRVTEVGNTAVVGEGEPIRRSRMEGTQPQGALWLASKFCAVPGVGALRQGPDSRARGAEQFSFPPITLR